GGRERTGAVQHEIDALEAAREFVRAEPEYARGEPGFLRERGERPGVAAREDRTQAALRRFTRDPATGIPVRAVDHPLHRAGAGSASGRLASRVRAPTSFISWRK